MPPQPRPIDGPDPAGGPQPDEGADTARPVAWSAIVLTGGSSTRMGTRKDVLDVGGVALVDRILAELPAQVPVIVVGPAPPVPGRDVVVTREQPPGSGPVAGIAAGLALVRTPLVALCAGDMPFAGAVLATLAQQFTGAPGPDAEAVAGVVPLDAGGHPQPLCAVYRADALRAAVAALGQPAGRSVRELTRGLATRTVALADDRALLDVDTPSDLAAARAFDTDGLRAPTIMAFSTGAADGSAGSVMKQWIDAVKQELGLDIEVDVEQILDVAKDAAHSVQRPAAPVTTFLLGYAIAAGADPGEAAGVIRRLAESWSAPE